MTSSPTGMWVGQSNTNASLDIQEGGYIKYTLSGVEKVGSWTPSGTGAISATFDGNSYSMPFERRDLTLKITLPGESQLSEFTQM